MKQKVLFYMLLFFGSVFSSCKGSNELLSPEETPKDGVITITPKETVNLASLPSPAWAAGDKDQIWLAGNPGARIAGSRINHMSDASLKADALPDGQGLIAFRNGSVVKYYIDFQFGILVGEEYLRVNGITDTYLSPITSDYFVSHTAGVTARLANGKKQEFKTGNNYSWQVDAVCTNASGEYLLGFCNDAGKVAMWRLSQPDSLPVLVSYATNYRFTDALPINTDHYLLGGENGLYYYGQPSDDEFSAYWLEPTGLGQTHNVTAGEKYLMVCVGSSIALLSKEHPYTMLVNCVPPSGLPLDAYQAAIFLGSKKIAAFRSGAMDIFEW